MRFRALVIIAILLAFPWTQCVSAQANDPNIASTPPLTPEQQLKTFHLPPGFVIQLVAAEPKVIKPINIAFDAMGRLWVTESVEYPFPAPAGREPKDKAQIFSDFSEDGRARTMSTFTGGLNIPIGILPAVNGHSAIIYSIPNIYQISDTDGDGHADKRTILYTAYGHRDTHGMTGEFTRGFDGWIYCCHGYSNTSTVKSQGDTAITMTSGNVYRIKPDGSRIEYVTHGQVNPFGLTFDALGNLYSCDCHSRPVYQLLKGAYYPSFGRPDDGLGFGPELLTHDHGSTAIAGITYYAADQFPPEFRDNTFIGNVVTNRINRDRLVLHGSTYKGIEMPDFVKCDDPWFRPVDIKLGPDGALYVADFYNRIIGHYEVPLNHPGRDHTRGRIWRIFYQGTDGQAKLKPFRDLTTATTPELLGELNNANLMVRMRAMEQLIARAPDQAVSDGVAHIVDQGTSFQKAHGMWVLERIGKMTPPTLDKLAADKDRLVRVHAMRVVTEMSVWNEHMRALALAGLKDDDAFVKRTAAAALGAHPEPSDLTPLLDLRHHIPAEDTHLLHQVRMSMRDQLKAPHVWEAIAGKQWSEPDSRALADVCLGVHDVPSAEFLKNHLEHYTEPLPNVIRYGHYIARFGSDGSSGWVLEWAKRQYPADMNVQGQTLVTVLRATQERGSKLDKHALAMAEEVTGRLLAPKSGHVNLGVDLAGQFRLGSSEPALLSIVNNSKANTAPRKAAVDALLAINAPANAKALGAILISPNESLDVRERIAKSLAGTNLPEARAILLEALQTAPARLQGTIAEGLSSSAAGGEQLLKAVAEGKASGRLLLVPAISFRLHQAKVANVSERIAKLTKGLPSADERVQTFINQRRLGFAKAHTDAAVGSKIFEKHCAICHIIGNKGAKIGPQLDGVGIRGLERLLEDTLDPSRNVDQAFRTTTLVLNNGQLVNGLLLRQDGNILVLADTAGKEVRVPAGDVQERLTSPLSPMPGNVSELIPENDFYHLLAYLLSQRVKR